MSTCINCELEVSTTFCPACGQRNPVKKINAVNMWNDFLSRVYGFDGMFPRTLRDLTIRPGQAAKEYIKGNRVKYYGPLGYFFLMITVYLLLASLLNIDMSSFLKESNPVADVQRGAGQEDIYRTLIVWINENLRLVTFVMALFTVFFSWLYFKKSGYNLVESAVLIFYISGHLVWLNILAILIYKFTGVAISFNYLMIVTLSFTLFSFVNFYTYQAKWKVLLKGLLSYISAYTLLLLISTMVLAYLIKTDQVIFEKIRPKNNKSTIEQSPTK